MKVKIFAILPVLAIMVLLLSSFQSNTKKSYENISVMIDKKNYSQPHKIFLSENTWSRTFGKILWHDAGFSIRKVKDGYIIGGLTSHYRNSFGWLIKINDNGEMEWNRIYTSLYYIMDVEVLEDGYLLTGITEDMDVGIIKTDGHGNVEWMKKFGGEENDGVMNDHCAQRTENGYIIAGYTHSFGAKNDDAWIIRIDENGNELWNKTYGGAENDLFYSIAESADGGYVAAGVSYSYGGNAWAVKIDEYGNILWNRTYGEAFTDGISCVTQCEDGYIMVGTRFIKEKRYYDLLVIKIDKDGNEIWNRTYGGNILYEYGKCIECTSDGYVICGLKEKDVQDFDLWLLKIDKDGNEIWNRTYGMKGFDSGNSILPTLDGYIVVGRLTQIPWKLFVRSDLWVIKTDLEGKIERGELIQIKPLLATSRT